MGYPSRSDANMMLAWAEEKNPGPWAAHSRVAGRAAETIATACGMAGEKAYILGLLHDIGRYEGISDLHHVIAGYDLLMQKGYEEAARICLTHSFAYQNFYAYSGKKEDCTEKEIELIKTKLRDIVYDDYDKLIQLCDAICLPQGVCLLEVRLLDVARRHGLNDFTLTKWESIFEQKAYFDGLAKQNIYDLFYQEIRDVSFGAR